jgi:hypothetical protein
MTPDSEQPVLFEGLAEKPIQVEFDQPAQSSDGGALLLKSVDRELGLTERLAASVRDEREPGKIDHTVRDLIRERVFAIACGYPDGNDAARLGEDPIFKILCDRSPAEGKALASQPTLSRFENHVRRTDLLRMGYALSDVVLETQRRRRRGRRTRQITIDMDSTCDPTHGEQQLTFFRGFYDTWCYLPMVTTIQFGQEPEQYLVAPVLRAGNAGGAAGAIAILKRLLPRVRRFFPRARIRVRMDGGFASPEVLAWLEEEHVEYVVSLPKNRVLEALAEPLMGEVRPRARRSKASERLFGEVTYKAGKWKEARRVIVKAEVTVLEGRLPRDNPRFVVTNSKRSPERVYAFYAARGDMENRIKELHWGLEFDRTSCSRFEANQLRNLLTAGAYVLYQHLRGRAARSGFGRAQVWTLRETLIKIGVTVIESVRRILVRAPQAFPWKVSWGKLAVVCGGHPT